jgi:type IX secretion system PorP/SprF family membrane protein
MKKLYFIAFLSLVFLSEVSAQQDPHYTQYMYNMSVMNPAYAGSKETISGGLLYRKQWIEIEDAPTTGTFFLHSPVGRNVGLGFSAINDRLLLYSRFRRRTQTSFRIESWFDNA